MTVASNTLEGSVDHLGRALVRLRTPDNFEFLCAIDSGFNRSLLLQRRLALEAGFLPFAPRIIENLRTASTVAFQSSEVMRGTIEWLGNHRLVDVHTVLHEPAGQIDGTPLVLLGIELLKGSLLSIDLAAMRVLIRGTVE